MKTHKQKISKLKVKLMDLIKAHVKKRDDHTCQRCGCFTKGHNEHASHVKPVSHYLCLAFDPINIKTLCYHCHTWWHENPTESSDWFKAKFPERWKYIEEHMNEEVHWKEHDYLEMIKVAEEL